MSEPDDEPQVQVVDLTQSDVRTVDAGSRAGVRRQKADANLRQIEAERFWRSVFASEVGRREMYALLEQAGTFETRLGVAPNGNADHDAMVFHMAQKGLGERWYLGWFKQDREGVMLMLDENHPMLKSDAAKPAPRRRARKTPTA